jgi:hypothetical protein
MVERIVRAGFLRDMRYFATAMSLGEFSRAAGLTVVRLSEIERSNGLAITDAELEGIGKVLADAREVHESRLRPLRPSGY